MTKKQKKTLIRIVSAAGLTVIASLSPLDGIWKGLAFAVPYLVIGWDVLWSAVRNIAHGQVFDEKFLMAVATLGAFAIREYPEAAAVMLFYQIGEWFQSIAVGKSRKSIAALMDIRPEYAVVLREGKEQEVDPEEVEIGEIIVLKPGERIPLDGTVIEGAGSVDTSALTGESLPADKTVGDTVLSGSINLSGVLKVKTSSEYAESTVARILELVENSSEKKARIENFITRFARWYTPLVVISAVLLAVIPPLFLSGSWADWINRALIFLVVSCPCALVVSVPLSFFGGIGGASRDGILVKGANYLEMLSKADTVVFDKTGTLTQGSFAVDAVHPSEISAEELLDIAAAAESYSSHPIAESVVSAFAGDIDRSRIGEIKEIAGMGIEAQVDGKTFFLGNGKLMEKAGAVWHFGTFYDQKSGLRIGSRIIYFTLIVSVVDKLILVRPAVKLSYFLADNLCRRLCCLSSHCTEMSLTACRRHIETARVGRACRLCRGRNKRRTGAFPGRCRNSYGSPWK